MRMFLPIKGPGGRYLTSREKVALLILGLTLVLCVLTILHGEDGYSRKGENLTNASYYYSQPRLRAEGVLELNGTSYLVNGLVWKDHEFSTSVLDKDQIGWDWFSLQFEDGSALMLFQLRESNGGISDSSSGTFIQADSTTAALEKGGFEITVLDEWSSPHTGGVYPSAWRIQLGERDACDAGRPGDAARVVPCAGGNDPGGF